MAVDDALYRYRTEVPEEPAMPKPVLTEEPVDPELQPGGSALLGGAMELNSPWERK